MQHLLLTRLARSGTLHVVRWAILLHASACGGPTGSSIDPPTDPPKLAAILTERPALKHGSLLDVPEETQAVVYITHPGDPRNADVSISFESNGSPVELRIDSYSSRSFSYSISSLDEPELKYVSGTEYTFEALLQSSSVPGRAALVAADTSNETMLTTVPELSRTSSTSSVLRHLLGVDLELRWSTPNTYGAVVVYRAVPGQPSLPFRVYDYPREWHGPDNFNLVSLQHSRSVVIPGDVFDQEAIYVVELRPFVFSNAVRDGYLSWHTYSAVSLLQLVQVGPFGL